MQYLHLICHMGETDCKIPSILVFLDVEVNRVLTIFSQIVQQFAIIFRLLCQMITTFPWENGNIQYFLQIK